MSRMDHDVCHYSPSTTTHFPFFFSSKIRHTILQGDWSSDVCSSDLAQDTIFTVFRALRIFLGADLVIVLVVPVLTPLPDVAVHVVQAELVHLVGTDRGGPLQIGT